MRAAVVLACIIGASAHGNGTVGAPSFPATIVGVLQSYGLNVRSYEVTTDDGYILENYYIRPPGTPRATIFFQHGLLDTAAGMSIHQIPPTNLFVMAIKAGIACVVGNNRGNGLSMKHVRYDPSEVSFWNFTYDDFALRDFPSQLKAAAALSPTGQVHYIGHSQGTTQFFMGLAHTPALSRLITGASLLAPVERVGHLGAWWMKDMAALPDWVMYDVLGHKGMKMPEILHRLFPYICAATPRLCDDVMELFGGVSPTMTPQTLEYIAEYLPGMTSILNLVHWQQDVNSGDARYFDWGSPQRNIAAYGTPRPPKVELSHLPGGDNSTAAALGRFHLYFGLADVLADPRDGASLRQKLTSYGIAYNFSMIANYTHTDPLWSSTANTEIYTHILEDALMA